MLDENTLVILWTSGDKGVALNMVFMYTLNSKLKDWWNDVRLIVWGSSAELLSKDKDLQESIGEMKEAGVTLEACRSCAENYGVVEDLEEMGIDVYYIGEQLTEYIKSEANLLTF